jgi:hypothetical protein
MSSTLDVTVSPVSLFMTGPTGLTWSKTWSQPFGRRLSGAWPQMEAYGWFTGEGTYRLRVVTNGGASAELEVGISGEEEAVTVQPRIETRETTGKPAIRALRILRVLPPPPGVVLRRAWNPTPDGTPKYELRNCGRTVLRSIVEGEIIRGVIQRWENGRWIVAPRGGWCATDGVSGGGIPPGASGTTEEMPFIAQPWPLTPGRYRYLAEYLSGSEAPTIGAGAEDRDGTRYERITVHRSTDTFETAWSPRDWARAQAGPPPACEYRGASYDGRLRVAVAGREGPALLFGVEAESPPTDDLLLILDERGLTSLSNPPCEVREEGDVPKVKVLVQYEGKVVDLAELILGAGHARVLSGDFPERTRYLEIERRARAASATAPGHDLHAGSRRGDRRP